MYIQKHNFIILLNDYLSSNIYSQVKNIIQNNNLLKNLENNEESKAFIYHR